MNIPAWMAALALLATAGMAASDSAPAQHLPKLVAMPVTQLYLGGPTDVSVDPTNPEPVIYGCTPYEVSTEGAQRCLRFDTEVANFGDGPLEVWTDVKTAAVRSAATQRISMSDGTYQDVPVGDTYFDPAHQHFHYADFASSFLWRSDKKGDRLDAQPIANGHKDGFCFEDSADLQPWRQTNPAYQYPNACYPVTLGNGSLYQVDGISVGYADVYDYTLSQQMIEVSQVADGYYLLETVVDPLHTLHVKDRVQDTSWRLIRLCGTQAEIVGLTRNCESSGLSTSPAHVTTRSTRP